MSEPARQRTIASEIEFSGVGLHSGAECRVRLLPATRGGVVFRCLGREGDGAQIKASPENVVSADHGTSLANRDGARIGTVEHLMAALALSRVDHVIVEVDGPEIPILDGSAAPFVAAIAENGHERLSAYRHPAVVQEKIRIGDEKRWIEFEPFAGRRLDIEINFAGCLIGRQTLSIDLEDPEDLVRLSTARTFVRLEEVEALKNAGLIRGGGLDNALVVDGEKLLNEDTLRDQAEFALHKALDLVGDLYLVGAPIVGRIKAFRPGHDLNTRAAMALAKAAGETAQPISATA
ncbi:UDP-3-O-acyl-N-acetylglucosamine deacetylase [Hyphococcus luteus]|uniref:UDP-3-O-acyl-N-acetylglucosamine deacetylase n=1 Tax=Hyphococcus luteus TaxID=2058213 RepID=A0A2S7K9A3_9PROT|nr:UDP-3-O-acyl-N-acetylglucosamine deacetylase [Marinicaulis flavus]PQA89080.1 UDP-3-O-[3-hydroxymyristoyl] N-acetylglucosamine deacetylase [Marinicaulis flavus]